MLVFALLFVIAFGLGPMAGVLAVVIHTLGALTKQFAEVVENIDMKPVEGVRSTGASWISCMRFAVVPQVQIWSWFPFAELWFVASRHLPDPVFTRWAPLTVHF